MYTTFTPDETITDSRVKLRQIEIVTGSVYTRF